MTKEILEKITALEAKVETFRADWQSSDEARIRFGEDDTRVDASEIAEDFKGIADDLAEIRQMVGE